VFLAELKGKSQPDPMEQPFKKAETGALVREGGGGGRELVYFE
jgi:hypothetical protein